MLTPLRQEMADAIRKCVASESKLSQGQEISWECDDLSIDVACQVFARALTKCGNHFFVFFNSTMRPKADIADLVGVESLIAAVFQQSETLSIVHPTTGHHLTIDTDKTDERLGRFHVTARGNLRICIAEIQSQVPSGRMSTDVWVAVPPNRP